MKTNDKGITLVALVITIIILIILASITLSMALGEGGLISKARNGGNKYQNASREEQAILGKVNEFLEGNYSSGGSTPSGGDNPNVNPIQEISLTKLMSFSGNSITSTSNRMLYIDDQSGNGNYAIPSDTTLTDDGKGLIFDGSTSTCPIIKNQTIDFPLSIETTFSTTTNNSGILYYDQDTKTAIGFWDNYLCVSISDDTVYVNIPSDYANGELKHIVVAYNTLTDFNVYFNGELCSKTESYDHWGYYGSTYIGGGSGWIFNGTVYTLRVYNKELSQQEVSASYSADLNMLNNNANNITRNNLYLEYVIKNNNTAFPVTIADQTGNGNNISCNNIYYDKYRKSFVFNGETSYGQIDTHSTLSFPLTVDVTISTKNNSAGIIYFDPTTNVCIGIYNNYLIFTINDRYSVVYLPSNFFNNTIHNIVVSYTSLENYIVYIDGVEQTLSSDTDYYGKNDNSYHSIGGEVNPNSSSYMYTGNLYGLDVYSGSITAEQSTTLYNNSVIKYPR